MPELMDDDSKRLLSMIEQNEEKTPEVDPQSTPEETPKTTHDAEPPKPEEAGPEKPAEEAPKTTPTTEGAKVDDDDTSEEKKSGEPAPKQEPSHAQKSDFAWKKLRGENKSLKKELAAAREQLEKYKNAKPSEEPDRAMFTSDADYYKEISRRTYADDMAKAKAEEAAQRVAQLEQAELADAIQRREQALFPDEKSYSEYSSAIGHALNSGMGAALEQNKDIKEFIDKSDMGPRLLYHFAMKPEDFAMISGNQNAASRSYQLAQLENALYQHFVAGYAATQNPPPKQEVPAPAPQTPPKPVVPVLGKVGNEELESTPADTFATDEQVRKALRKYY